MKTFSLIAAILTLGLALTTGDAEAAKRLGGGKSTGMQRQTTTQSAPTNTPPQTAAAPAAAAQPATAAAQAAQPKRSWMGPLAGLAAGLGLAALASHLGFGEAFANMLMIGLLVMGVVLVIGMVMRKRAAANAQADGLQYAGATAQPGAPMARSYEQSMPTGGSIGSGVGSQIGANVVNTPAARWPADFDAAAFERQSKVQFIRLQAANDAGNLDDLRAVTTPEMFAELQVDLAERGSAPQQTEVLSVNAEVLEVVEEGKLYVASVRFTGQIREDRLAPAESFDEIWHLTKPRDGSGGWLLSGIQQAH